MAARQAEAKLVHTMDMLGAFGALRVEVPLTTARVPAALEALEERRQYYLRKRAEVRAPARRLMCFKIGQSFAAKMMLHSEERRQYYLDKRAKV